MDTIFLKLGLAFTDQHPTSQSPLKLNLTLGGDTIDLNDGQDSPLSAKREREFLTEEIETERVSSEDDDTPNCRKKLRLTKPQSALLEQSFRHHTTLNPKQKQELARELKLRPRQVEVWFQNRRARTKLKQTEIDFAFMKKYCETLMEENRWLHKELKALQLSHPLNTPAATLTLCPSCEKITAVSTADNNNPSKGLFTLSRKPHLFTNAAY